MTEQAKLQYTGSERFWLLAKSKTTTCRRAALLGRIFRSIDIIYLKRSIYLADIKRTVTRHTPFYFLAYSTSYRYRVQLPRSMDRKLHFNLEFGYCVMEFTLN